MSIPTNQLVYAGVWSATISYPQFQFVQSPIDSLCYVNVGLQPSLGGSDPSVQPSAVWVLLNVPNVGGITSLNGLVDPALTLQSSDASITINPIAPSTIDLTTTSGFVPIYGSFSSTATQPVGAGLAVPLIYDTNDIAPTSGINVLFPDSKISVATTGVYKVLTSIQCDSTLGLQTLTAFLSLNGNPVANTSTRVVVNLNTESLITVEWFIQITAGEYVEVVLYDPVGGGQAVAFPAQVPPSTPVPATPSVITTILRIA